jgi:hypothetical protein
MQHLRVAARGFHPVERRLPIDETYCTYIWLTMISPPPSAAMVNTNVERSMFIAIPRKPKGW